MQEQKMHPENACNDKSGQPLPISSTTIQRRPWPTRKVSETEEMVKHMSNIPRYLQSEEIKSNIQAKAMNVGVLDWGRLQMWTEHDSASSTNPSSLSSAFDPFPHSSRSNASPSTERKQSSNSKQPCKSSSTSDSGSLKEKDLSKGRRKNPSTHTDKSQLTDVGSLPSALVGPENFTLLHRNANTNVAKLDGLKKLEISSEQGSSRSHSYEDGDRLKQSRRKHLEEIIARSMCSFDTTMFDQQKEMNGSIPAGISPPLHSSASSSTMLKGETQPAKTNSSSDRGREHPPIFLPRVDLKGIGGSPLKSIADNRHEAIARSSSRGRRSQMGQFFDQPHISSSSISSVSDIPNDIGRSSSRDRRRPVNQVPDSPMNSSMPDVSLSRSNSRGRRSPLRQMFEYPRKSTSSINTSQQQPHETSGIVDPPTCNETPSSDPKNSALMRQALLKLSLKNGLPLLMFSSSDDSILVAMMHKENSSDMNICDCFYEIHTAMLDVKKRSGAWLTQGTKSKKPEFTRKFAAELIVSSSEQVSFDHTRCSFKREFVLLGDELAPTNGADAANLSSSELAAIVIETPQQQSPSNCGIHCIQKIIALLPSDVHGLSNSKEPSKLIERWKSGGSCDCGGWDEGCALTVLTNNSQQVKNSTSVDGFGAVDETSCGFDLFAEGDARRGKHSFRMAAFKEDLLTVEFKASIHLLQAFAISIALLHHRNNWFDMDNNYGDLSFESYSSISS